MFCDWLSEPPDPAGAVFRRYYSRFGWLNFAWAGAADGVILQSSPRMPQVNQAKSSKPSERNELAWNEILQTRWKRRWTMQGLAKSSSIFSTFRLGRSKQTVVSWFVNFQLWFACSQSSCLRTSSSCRSGDLTSVWIRSLRSQVGVHKQD